MKIKCNNRGFNKKNIPEFKKSVNATSWFSLNFTRNKLEDLPQNLFKSIESKITTADLSRNRFANLPFALRNLTSLKLLDLNGNLFDLDEENQFRNLTRLRILSLSHNHIRVIKKNVFRGLNSLMILNLDNNSITEIQSDLSSHTRLLNTIMLTDNLLPDIPDFGALPILTKIYLSGNKISVLQNSAFSTMVNVKGIYLNRNKNLHSIHPNTFSNLKRLALVELHFCNLTILPAGLLAGSPITFLSLFGNRLTDSDLLVDAIMGSRLNVMSISYNLFTHITPRLCQYLNFRILHMAGNPFKDVPSVDNCTNLVSLSVKNTEITTLREHQFKGLKHLRELWWGGSPFHCDCRLSWALSDPRGFLYHKYQTNQDTCAEPPDKRGKRLTDLSPDELVCDSTSAPFTTKRIAISTVPIPHTSPAKFSTTGPDIVTVITEQHITKPSVGHNSKKIMIALCCFIVMIILGMVAVAVFVFRKWKWPNVRFPSETARYFDFDSHAPQDQLGAEGANPSDHSDVENVDTLSPNQPVKMSCLMAADDMGEPN